MAADPPERPQLHHLPGPEVDRRPEDPPILEPTHLSAAQHAARTLAEVGAPLTRYAEGH